MNNNEERQRQYQQRRKLLESEMIRMAEFEYHVLQGKRQKRKYVTRYDEVNDKLILYSI